MRAGLDRELPRAGEADVAAFQGDAGLSGLQHDLVLRQHVDAGVGGGDGHRLVGQQFQRAGMCLQAHRAGGGDEFDRSALGEQRGVLAGHRRQGLPGAQLRILLHGQLQACPA